MSRQDRKVLRKLALLMPSFACKEGCHDCCGPVPFTPEEKAAVAHVEPNPNPGPFCMYLGPAGCRVYENRPLLCRAYGAIDEPTMKCPHGCGPEQPLSGEKLKRTLNDYMAMGPKPQRSVTKV